MADIGPSTSNQDLSNTLASIAEDDELFFQLGPDQQGALYEAVDRIRELPDEEG